jgi:hypothetical protein
MLLLRAIQAHGGERWRIQNPLATEYRVRPSAAPNADTQSRFSRFGPYPGARTAAVHNIGSCSGRGSSRGLPSEARPAHDAVVERFLIDWKRPACAPEEYQRRLANPTRGRGATLLSRVRPPLPDSGVIEFL